MFVLAIVTPDPQHTPLPAAVTYSLLVGGIVGGTPALIVWAMRRSFRALRDARRTWSAERPRPAAPNGTPVAVRMPPVVSAPPSALGPGPPKNRDVLGTGDLHHWIRDAVAGRWEVRHYGDAVAEAARILSGRTQQKIRRYDVTDGALMREVFSAKDPQHDAPRLRFLSEPGEQTRRSRLEGARGLAEACYSGVRNVVAHHTDLGWSPAQAFSYLAMFSVLATWIEEAHVWRLDARYEARRP